MVQRYEQMRILQWYKRGAAYKEEKTYKGVYRNGLPAYYAILAPHH